MGNATTEIKNVKLSLVQLLANALTRYTSFNHLANAARAVLNNKEQINQMYNDFCKYVYFFNNFTHDLIIKFLKNKYMFIYLKKF